MSAVPDYSYDGWLEIAQHATQYFDYLIFPNHPMPCRIVLSADPVMTRFSPKRVSVFDPMDGAYYISRSRYLLMLEHRQVPRGVDSIRHYEALALATAATLLRVRIRNQHCIPLRGPWGGVHKLSFSARRLMQIDPRMFHLVILGSCDTKIREISERMVDSIVTFKMAYDTIVYERPVSDDEAFSQLIAG